MTQTRNARDSNPLGRGRFGVLGAPILAVSRPVSRIDRFEGAPCVGLTRVHVEVRRRGLLVPDEERGAREAHAGMTHEVGRAYVPELRARADRGGHRGGARAVRVPRADRRHEPRVVLVLAGPRDAGRRRAPRGHARREARGVRAPAVRSSDRPSMDRGRPSGGTVSRRASVRAHGGLASSTSTRPRGLLARAERARVRATRRGAPSPRSAIASTATRAEVAALIPGASSPSGTDAAASSDAGDAPTHLREPGPPSRGARHSVPARAARRSDRLPQFRPKWVPDAARARPARGQSPPTRTSTGSSGRPYAPSGGSAPAWQPGTSDRSACPIRLPDRSASPERPLASKAALFSARMKLLRETLEGVWAADTAQRFRGFAAFGAS
jgi:hypothetical protein